MFLMNDRLQHTLDFIKNKKAKGSPGKWVYVVKCGEFYKVGIANSVKRRLETLQTATPYRIELVKAWQCSDAAKQERTIHGLLWRFHERGEWFKLPIQVVLSFGSCTHTPVEALKKALASL